MINWNDTHEVTPAAGREIIVRNPNKDISHSSSAKQCAAVKYAAHFNEAFIKDLMLGDDYTQWVYVEGDNDE